jgi:hypothetical protein
MWGMYMWVAHLARANDWNGVWRKFHQWRFPIPHGDGINFGMTPRKTNQDRSVQPWSSIT